MVTIALAKPYNALGSLSSVDLSSLQVKVFIVLANVGLIIPFTRFRLHSLAGL
ncbi:MAG: hypothetical protein LBC86_08610 [Oscillospiraceae bacterium]|nr:hypothetical protein [Oscillospiraceae bacterium]